jgi:hypothetical protein
MAETWIQRVARVYKEKKAKDPNYKYKNAMKDAKVGYTALAEPAAASATKSTKAKKSKKSKKGGDGEPTDEVIKEAPAADASSDQTEDGATAKGTDDGAATVGGKRRKSKKRSRKTKCKKTRKSRKSRKGKK